MTRRQFYLILKIIFLRTRPPTTDAVLLKAREDELLQLGAEIEETFSQT